MKTTDLLVIGGGPAGISASLAAGKLGLNVLLIEERESLGGQLTKQTHRFFGSQKEHAGTRGITIAEELKTEVSSYSNIEVWLSATALGLYEDGVATILKDHQMVKVKPQAVVVATGAFEKFLPFENNDLPGIYGAGAVQTLMNIYGVLPGKKIVMVGSGNIGLIVSYQLIQAGAEVVAVVEAAPKIGGYLVHASKLRRLGVPIYTSCTVRKAIGTETVEGAELVKVDEKWQEIPNSSQTVECDVICLAVGLNPLIDILGQIHCEMKYIPELGGQIPVHDETMQTNIPWLYVAGDLSGIEEATAALLGGELAGLQASQVIRQGLAVEERIQQIQNQLTALRSGAVGEKIRIGLAKLYQQTLRHCSSCQKSEVPILDLNSLSKTGIPDDNNLKSAYPEEKRRVSKPYAVIECFQPIPCDPCVYNCPTGAIQPFVDINDIPQVDFNKCTGCGLCIGRCPGLAIFLIHEKAGGGKARLTLPYELLPKPSKEQVVSLLDREGKIVGSGIVKGVLNTQKQDKTTIVTVEMGVELVHQVRNIRMVNTHE